MSVLPPPSPPEVITDITSIVESVITEAEKGISALQEKINSGKIASADFEVFENMKKSVLELRQNIENNGGEGKLPDDLRIKLHQIEEAAKQANLPGIDTQTQKTLKDYQGTTREKIKQYASDNPGKSLVGAGVFSYCLVSEIAEHKSWPGKIRGSIWGSAKGVFYGGLSMLGINLLEKGYDRASDAYHMVTHPVEALKQGISRLGESILSLKDRVTGSKNSYDPKAQDVHEARQDTDINIPGNQPAALYIDEKNGNIMGKWMNGTTQRMVTPGDVSLLPAEAQKLALDSMYNSPNLTGKYMLYLKTMHMITHAARKKMASTGKLHALSTISICEQDLLNTQKALFTGKDINQQEKKFNGPELEANMIEQLNHVSQNLEGYFDGVIGVGDWQAVIETIKTFDVKEGRYDDLYTTAELKIYHQFRNLGGQGDSDVVANQLTQELMQQEGYTHLLDCFDQTQYPELLAMFKANRNGVAGQKEQITTKITNHLREHSFLQSNIKAGLSESQILPIVEKMIETYNTISFQTEDPQDKAGVIKQMKGQLQQAYGDIDHESNAQQKMILSYETQAGEGNQDIGKQRMGEYAISHPIGGKSYQSNPYDYILSYAFDTMKEGAVKTGVICSFQSEFLLKYLPTQRVVTGTEVVGMAASERNLYGFTDLKQGMLADILGVNYTRNVDDDLADATISSAVNIGVNVGLCLIPGLGAEMMLARVGLQLARLGRVANVLSRVIVAGATGHVVKTAMDGLIYHKDLGEIRREFSDLNTIGNNMLLYGTLGRLREILTIIPGIGAIGKAVIKITPDKLQPLAGHWLVNALGVATGTTAVVEIGRNFFDEQYERNRKEVVTIFMLTLALQGSLQGYKAIKDARGKVMLVKNDLQQSLDLTKFTATHQSTLEKLAVDEEITIMGYKVKRISPEKSGNSTYNFEVQGGNGVWYKFGNESHVVLNVIKYKFGSLTTENAIKALADDLEQSIDDLVATGKPFRLGKNEYKFVQNEGGGISLAKKGLTGFKAMTDAELKLLLEAEQQVMMTKGQAIYQQLSQSSESVSQFAKRIGENKNAFMQWCENQTGTTWTEKLTVGDLFQKIGLKQRKKLLIDMTPTNPISNRIPFSRTINISKALYTKFPQMFNIAATASGRMGADGDGGGFHEGLINYVAYGVVARSIPGKILMMMIDDAI